MSLQSGVIEESGTCLCEGKTYGEITRMETKYPIKSGKELLIKVVAQAISAYPINIFKFPVGVCNQLDAMIVGFWWGATGGVRKFIGFQRRLWGFQIEWVV